MGPKPVTSDTTWGLVRNANIGGFPGGPVVKNIPSNAGDMGSIPGQENKFPYAVGHLSPCATARGACGPQ